MADWGYSNDAENILNQFYSVDKVVYVEGDDDVIFWEFLFEKFTNLRVKVEEVGGKEELKKYAGRLISHELDFVVAMDSDYEYLEGGDSNCNILRTFGYSIENTLVSEETIYLLIRMFTNKPKRKINRQFISEWISELPEHVVGLLLYDVINYQNNLSISVIPNAADRFMKSKDSCFLCEHKVRVFIERLENKFAVVEEKKIRACMDTLNDSHLSALDIIRGHFLFSMATKCIKYCMKKLDKDGPVSNDVFFSSFMQVFQSSFNEEHPHYLYYKNQLGEVAVK